LTNSYTHHLARSGKLHIRKHAICAHDLLLSVGEQVWWSGESAGSKLGQRVNMLSMNWILGFHGSMYEDSCLMVVVVCSLVEVYDFRGPYCLHYQGDESLVMEAARTS
jgi:hypothetical protein